VRHIDEYRDKDLITKLSNLIKNAAIRNYTFMEVCGGHTSAINRFGIHSLLPGSINLISGPGCPVCVTDTSFIDKAIALSKSEDIIIATFGDLIRVPGSESSLEKEKMMGRDIRIVLSGLEALDIAKANNEKKIIFLGIGFETTAPGTAVTIRESHKAGTGNFFLLSAHKLMPPAMEVIIKEGINLDGFICPGHVAAITGSDAFRFIPEHYKIGCVITGFEPVDILQAIYMLVKQVNRRAAETEIQYRRAVTKSGNRIALQTMNEVFEPSDEHWRGLGLIPSSGLKLRKVFEKYDAEKLMQFSIKEKPENKLCICSEILRGVKTPSECSLFGRQCVPENPIGACMVSAEGACNVFFKYR
jgi:hydrogenase expression/formation protein HypD